MDAIKAIIADGSTTVLWDLVGMHCECRFLCGSGLHWNKRRPERAKQTEEAFQHVMACVAAAEKYSRSWYLENSTGLLSTRWRKPDQIIQPYQFGDDASKATCLWLGNLPRLRLDPAKRFKGRMVEWPRASGKFVERWANQTDSGQNRLPPSADRSAKRAQTYPGIAAAMAEQWGDLRQEPDATLWPQAAIPEAVRDASLTPI